LLQQFAAIKAAAAKQEQEEADDDTAMEEVETPQEPSDDNVKKWSLEDDDESEEEHMDVDAKEDDDFIPLQKPKKEEESLLTKPKKTFLMSNLSTKPKNTMRIGGFGGSNKMGLTMKKPAMKKDVEMKPAAVPEKKEEKVEDDIDPLEAYMMDVHAETKKINEQDKQRMEKFEKTNRRGSIDDEDDDDLPAANINDEEEIGSDPEDILS
jgi:ATP-dependent RNA helicase DDX46/PRP5